ncbi:hypothetical protein MN608_11311 [Microdochium nivale]|nr:hypothetical protein MN608_11311 [Microdochium nivale]
MGHSQRTEEQDNRPATCPYHHLPLSLTPLRLDLDDTSTDGLPPSFSNRSTCFITYEMSWYRAVAPLRLPSPPPSLPTSTSFERRVVAPAAQPLEVPPSAAAGQRALVGLGVEMPRFARDLNLVDDDDATLVLSDLGPEDGHDGIYNTATIEEQT